jgi:hypothetical protein
LIAAAASLMRGGKYHYSEPPPAPLAANNGKPREDTQAPSHAERSLVTITTKEEQHAS